MMGDMADMYMDIMMESALDEPEYVDQVPKHYWRMGNGQLIAISDMTTRHLNNTIRFLKRQIDGSAHDDFVHDNVETMEQELRKRGLL
jgi:hypothetical protein